MGESRSGKSFLLTEFFLSLGGGVRGAGGGVRRRGRTVVGWRLDGGGENRPVLLRRSFRVGGEEEGERVGERERVRPRVFEWDDVGLGRGLDEEPVQNSSSAALLLNSSAMTSSWNIFLFL